VVDRDSRKNVRPIWLGTKILLNRRQAFHSTGDTRGRIYTLLGFAETEWLEAHPSKGLATGESQYIADQSDFLWEKLHVEALKEGQVNPLASKYQKTGSKFHPETFPVNWP